jgi:SAM-dependent methyltransferase
MRIKCPNCEEGYELKLTRRVSCPACGHDLYKGKEYVSTELYSKRAGFDPGTSYEDFLSKAEKFGWEKALEGRGDLAEWCRLKNRADGLTLTKVDKSAVVLDYGCGFGTLSCAASSLAREVVSLDVSSVYIRGLNMRIKQGGYTNIFPIISDYYNFPFFKNTFDLIIVNGVLEYIPCQNLTRPHEEMVRDFIKALTHVLKPGGQIYIAIENRYGLNYLLGGKDEHTNLRFVTVLPRRLSEIYSKHCRGLPYREWTYSHKELKRFFSENLNFHQKFYAVLPDYRYPNTFISLDNPYLLNHFLKSSKGATGSLKRRIAIWIAMQASRIGITKLSFLRKLVPCFAGVFTKIGAPTRSQEKTEPPWLGGQLQNNSSDIMLRKGENSLNAIIMKKKCSRPEASVRFTVDNLLVEGERKILNYLRSLQNKEIDKWLNYPNGETDFGGGKAVYYSWLKHAKRKVSKEEALHFLSILSVVPLPEFLDSDRHDRFIARKLTELTGGNDEMAKWYSDWVLAARKRAALKIVHGDYHPLNFLYTSSGCKIIDWEYVHRGTPLEDWLWLMISRRKGFRLSHFQGYLKVLHEDQNPILSDFNTREVDVVAALLSVGLRLIDQRLLRINDLAGFFHELK